MLHFTKVLLALFISAVICVNGQNAGSRRIRQSTKWVDVFRFKHEGA